MKPRIIIPFIDKEGNVFGYQGRSLSNTGLRYITILLEEDQTQNLWMNTIDYEQNITSQKDPSIASYLTNAIAMAGADACLPSDLRVSDVVFVYDNEPRNTQITSRSRNTLTDGQTELLSGPQTIKEKDINDMYLAGHPVQEIVKSNTYSGLTATLKLNDWRK